MRMKEKLTYTLSFQPLAHVSQSLATCKQELNQMNCLKLVAVTLGNVADLNYTLSKTVFKKEESIT